MFCVGRKPKSAVHRAPTATQLWAAEVDESTLEKTLDKLFGEGGWRTEERGDRIIVWAPRKLTACEKRKWRKRVVTEKRNWHQIIDTWGCSYILQWVKWIEGSFRCKDWRNMYLIRYLKTKYR